MESRSNLGFGRKLTPNPIFATKSAAWFVGRSVKVAFATECGPEEYMWVEIDRMDGDELSGTLGNDPVHRIVGGLLNGSLVNVRRDQIIDVYNEQEN